MFGATKVNIPDEAGADEGPIMTDCKTCQNHFPDLLLQEDFLARHPEMAGHLAACEACRTEVSELQATSALLTEWSAPEPSAFFDSKLHARLREAQTSAPESLWERLRSFLLFSTGRQLRPALAGALAFALLVGGGTFAGLHGFHSHDLGGASATVNDLNILDNNAQALQQMDQLLDEANSNTDDGSSQPAT